MEFSDGEDKEDESGAPRLPVQFLTASSSHEDTIQAADAEDTELSLLIDQQILIDSLIPPSETVNFPVDVYSLNPSFPDISISGLTPSEYCEAFEAPASPSPLSISLQHVPRSPKSNTIQPIRFFLKYHSECVLYSHYYRWFDYDEFCSKELLGMTENYEPLRLAVTGFGALLYSMKVNIQAREVAFVFYALAVQRFRESLERSLYDGEYYPAIATALQLSTFDVTTRSIKILTVEVLWRYCEVFPASSRCCEYTAEVFSSRDTSIYSHWTELA
jgi:hypothetical protein